MIYCCHLLVDDNNGQLLIMMNTHWSMTCRQSMMVLSLHSEFLPLIMHSQIFTSTWFYFIVISKSTQISQHLMLPTSYVWEKIASRLNHIPDSHYVRSHNNVWLTFVQRPLTFLSCFHAFSSRVNVQ